MQNELIKLAPTEIGGETIQTVNARDLHAFLEVGSAFKDWIARRIQDYDFQDGKDFCSFLSESQGGRPSKEYAISIDMAKELAMVERNDKGKQARQYFIECERIAKAAPAFDPASILESPAAMRGLLLTYTEKVLALEAQNEAMRADVDALATIAKADGSLCLTDAAKALQHRPKDLVAFLSNHKWIYRRAGSDHWVGYQSRTQNGDLAHKVTTVLRPDGSEKITEQVRVTPQGLAKLAKLFPSGVAVVAA